MAGRRGGQEGSLSPISGKLPESEESLAILNLCLCRDSQMTELIKHRGSSEKTE